MPMCDSELAGSRPRNRSNALALIARAWAAGGSSVARGNSTSAPAGRGQGAGIRQVIREPLQEQPSERARVARIPREQGSLDRLGQVDQREHGPVEVREVRAQALELGLGEALDRIVHGRSIVATVPVVKRGSTRVLRVTGRLAALLGGSWIVGGPARAI